MNDLERNYYLERDKQYSREQNQAELERLRSQAYEMRQELDEDRLGEAARRDLQEQLAQTNEAIQILRDSLLALASKDALFVEDQSEPISVEITDPEAYWQSEYAMKCRELEELLKEYALFQSTPPSEARLVRINKLEVDIDRIEKEAEEALENFHRIKQ